MYDGFNDGLMEGGGSMEMERLRKMLAASRAMDQQQAQAQVAEPPPSPEPAAVEQPSAAPPPPKPAPPAPAPMMSPKLGPRFSFDPRTPQADEYKGIVQDYQGNRMAGELPGTTYKDPTGLTRNVPQVYGQEGSPADPDEGPRTPEETAAELARIDSQPGGMAKQIKQHTLGYGLGFGERNAKRRQHYDAYVQQSRAKQDAERTARQERAFANRADIRDRDALTMQKMADYNSAIQGGGSMGSYDNSGPTVGRVGGIGFIRGAGRFRPADTMEQAELANKNAQTQYMLSRPAQAEHKSALDELKFGLQQDKEKRLARQHQDYMGLRQKAMQQGDFLRKQSLAAMQNRDAAKMAESSNAVEQRMLQTAQLLKMKMENANKDTWFSDPDPARLDVAIDPKTKEVGNAIPGDWDMWKNSFIADYNLLRQLGAEGVLPEIDEVYQQIEKLNVGK